MRTAHFALLSIVAMAGCKPDTDTPDPPAGIGTPYTLQLPSNMPPMSIPANNPLTVEGIKLGPVPFLRRAAQR
jgi:hypothetical protein